MIVGKTFHRITVCIVLALFGMLFITEVVAAQAPNPDSWQDSAVGLSVQQNDELETAGLGFIVQAQEWPFVALRGGVENSGSYRGSRLDGPVGIELGQVRIPGAIGALALETTDWGHNEMVFRYGGSSELTMWVSRLSPALLLHSQANSVDLFSGSVAGNEFYVNQWGVLDVRATFAPALLKYVAYPTGEGISVSPLTSSGIDLSEASDNWLLVWYGENSHFLNSKMPLSYEWTVPFSWGYQGDVPILIVLENKPTTIEQAPEGGIRISHQSPGGYIVVLPLFGRDILLASDTETWSQALPTDVLERARWWAEHLCAFPISARETYGYDKHTDKAIITESLSFRTVCEDGTTYAPIPPMLAIAYEALDVDFSASLVDGRLNTEYGPTLGVEGVDQYTWAVSGLSRYTDARRVVADTGRPPPELEQELTAELQKLISTGHMAPWIFMDGIPQHIQRGDLYWANPADILYHLLEVLEVVEDEALREDLISYIGSVRTEYPPEEVYDLPLTEGTLRGPYSCYECNWEYVWTQARVDVHLRSVPLFSLYALGRYYDLIDSPPPTDTWQSAQDVLDQNLREQDWATFYWFQGFDDRRVAVRNANRHFAGAIGYVRLAQRMSDIEGEALGRALLAKAVVLRLGMALYPRYMYRADLVQLPSDPDWHPTYVREPDIGYLYNFEWVEPYQDARQVGMLNQFGVYLMDHSGYMRPGTGYDEWDSGLCSAHLIAFYDLVPELGRMLGDLAKPDVEAYIFTVERLYPHWYAAFAEGTLGVEHNLNHPIDSFQIFMAKSLIQQTEPESLTTYIDIPWLERGDLFYIQKLAEGIKAYRGTVWEDMLLLTVRPGDRSLNLTWQTFTELPAETRWQISYDGPAGDQASPIVGIPNSIRNYELTGLTNYAWYTITLSAALLDGTVLLEPFLTSDQIAAMPTDLMVYLPLILRVSR